MPDAAGSLTDTFQLSPQQECLWLHSPSRAATAIVCAGTIAGDAGSVRERLEALAATHEILRTTYPQQLGVRVPLQRVHGDLPVEWLELAGGASLAALVEAVSEPFDLEHGPVIRAAVASSERGLLAALATPALTADPESLVHVLETIGRSGAPSEGTLQYADYAGWRASMALGEEAGSSTGREWWSDRLREWPAADANSGEALIRRLPIAIDGARLRELARVAAELDTDVAAILESAWRMLAVRTTDGEPAFVVRSAGRGHDELAEAIGLFTSYLPASALVGSEASYADLVASVARCRDEREQWQDCLSATEMQRAFAASHAFACIDARGTAAQTLDWQGSGAPLELVLTRLASDLHLEVRHSTSDEEAERTVTRFLLLLDAALTDSARNVLKLPVLPESERALIRDVLAPGPRVVRNSETFDEMFTLHALDTPDVPAVDDGTSQLSYAELDALANRIANELREQGVMSGDVVALCLDRSTKMIAALLGILKVGAAYLPLDFQHPHGRLAHQLEETGAAAIVTLETLLGRLPPLDLPVLCLDRDAARIEAQSAAIGERSHTDSDLIYVMYTSGSTGMPKGVEVTHRSAVNYTHSIIDMLAPRNDRLTFAVVSAISTDLGNTSVFGALGSGGLLHLIQPDVSMDGREYAEYVARSPIDVLKITPSHLTALIAGAAGADVLPRRVLIVGGERFSPDLAERVAQAGCRVLNHYGPTETTIGSCAYELPRSHAKHRSGSIPLGRALPNTELYILDDEGELVPVGAPGEIVIGGEGVARGYVARADETQKRFVPHPFDPGRRVYRTGDRGRYLEDGAVEFLGRGDEQVKIRGYRVEPGEVEAVLLRHADVRQAVVVARADEAENVRLLAYVVSSNGATSAQLVDHARESLPDYMVPSAVVLLDDLPRTASGKVDRKQLPDPALEAAADFVAPRTALEQGIMEIWAEVLGVERVGVTDDFFSLGGHSLLATQVIARIRSRYADIPLHSVFTSPTVAGLAEVLRESQLDALEAGVPTS